jgi:hypothetical protein
MVGPLVSLHKGNFMRYVQHVAAASLAVCIAVLACNQSDDQSSTTAPSSSPPSSAVAATVPCIGVDPVNDQTAYGEKRVFLESQGWWGARKTDGSVPRYGNAEHIHVGLCFPLKGVTVTGTKTLRVRVMGHNLPINSIIKTTLLHDPDGDGGALPLIHWDDTVRASDNGNVVMWRTVQVNTANIPNGLREFRNLTVVRRPDGDELHASSAWCWQISNGSATPVASGTCIDTPESTMARGWYNCFEYKIAETRHWAYPYGGVTRNVPYTLEIGGRDGASSANNDFTGWEARWDPDFHNGINGTLIQSGTGPGYGVSITIPASLMTGVTGGKIHKLVIIGFDNGACTPQQNGELTAVFAVPIKVN